MKPGWRVFAGAATAVVAWTLGLVGWALVTAAGPTLDLGPPVAVVAPEPAGTPAPAPVVAPPATEDPALPAAPAPVPTETDPAPPLEPVPASRQTSPPTAPTGRPTSPASPPAAPAPVPEPSPSTTPAPVHDHGGRPHPSRPAASPPQTIEGLEHDGPGWDDDQQTAPEDETRPGCDDEDDEDEDDEDDEDDDSWVHDDGWDRHGDDSAPEGRW